MASPLASTEGGINPDSGLNFVAVGAASLILLAPRAGDEAGGYAVDLALFSGGRKNGYQHIYQHDLGRTVKQ